MEPLLKIPIHLSMSAKNLMYKRDILLYLELVRVACWLAQFALVAECLNASFIITVLSFLCRSFAYLTVKDRMPTILTRVIDTIHRNKDKFLEEYGKVGCCIGRLSHVTWSLFGFSLTSFLYITIEAAFL